MRSLEFENDDLFGEPGRVYRGAAADINEYSNPLGDFRVSNIEYEELHSAIADATGYNWTDAQYEALVTPLYDTVDEPLADFFDNVLNDNPRAESDRFVDQLTSILQSNYQRFGTEPRAAVDGVTRALERGYRIAQNMWGNDVEIDESDDNDLFGRPTEKVSKQLQLHRIKSAADIGPKLSQYLIHTVTEDPEGSEWFNDNFSPAERRQFNAIAQAFATGIKQGYAKLLKCRDLRLQASIDEMISDWPFRDIVYYQTHGTIPNYLKENDDDLFEPQTGGKFWSNTPPEYEQLYAELVPAHGPASTLEGELLRAASRLYYQYFNNGWFNNVSGAENFIRQFAQSTPAMQRALYTIHPYTRCDTQDLENKQTSRQVEIALDTILQGVLRQVQAANGNYHPNTNDMYDMFDYEQPDDDVEPADDYDGYEEPDYDEDNEDLAESNDDLFEPSQRVKILHAIRGMQRGGDINGTSLQGTVRTTYAQLLQTFGKPMFGPDERDYDKVTCEWVITFGDDSVATIYDWKTRYTPRGEYDWHIGGHRKVVAEYVRVALDLGRDAVVTEDDDDLFGQDITAQAALGQLKNQAIPINKRLSLYFRFKAAEYRKIADEMIATGDENDLAGAYLEDAASFQSVAQAFSYSLDEGLREWRELDTILREETYEDLLNQAGIDLVLMKRGNLAEDDDDLFEPRAGYMPGDVVAKIMPAVNHFMQHVEDDDDMIELGEQEPQVYAEIMRDFRGAAQELGRGNVIKAMAYLENSPVYYDLDDWFLTLLIRRTGIDLSDYYDYDNPRHVKLFWKYSNEIKALKEYGMSGFQETKMKEVREFVEWTRSVVTEDQDDDLFEPTASPTLLKLYKELDEVCEYAQEQGYQDYGVFEMMLRSSETWEEIFERLGGEYNTTERDIIKAATAEERQELIQDMTYYLNSLRDELDLTESDRKKKTQTKTDQPGLDPNMFAPRQDQPLARPEPQPDQTTDQPRDIRRASAARTRQATAGITPTDQMRDMLGRLRNIEIDPNLEPYPDTEPETLPSVDVTTQNLPAVAGANMQAAGIQNPEFYQVAALPGNMAAVIRQLGKSLFASMTATPTNNIYVVANLGGQGPNTTQEVNAVAGYLRDHGTNIGPGDIDFSKIMPGYSAETNMFSAGGIRWLLVRDFAGQYIYAWPEADSVDYGQEPKKLR